MYSLCGVRHTQVPGPCLSLHRVAPEKTQTTLPPEQVPGAASQWKLKSSRSLCLLALELGGQLALDCPQTLSQYPALHSTVIEVN